MILSFMKTSASKPDNAELKLTELTQCCESLRQVSLEVHTLFNKIQWGKLNPSISEAIDRWVVYHQTFPMATLRYWNPDPLSESSEWILKQKKSDTVSKIIDVRTKFWTLSQDCTSIVGQVCWYEGTEFSLVKPWPKNEKPLLHIVMRYQKTAYYASKMKSSHDSVNKLTAQFSLHAKTDS